MIEDEPNLIKPAKSQQVVVDGHPFSIQIYRLETDKTWTLEVVDLDGTSHVWDEQFKSDKDARNVALEALDVTSRKMVGLFLEQVRLQFVPVLHRLQGRLATQG